MSRKYIYADYAATAPIPEAVREAILPWLVFGGNPSAVHSTGRDARDAVERARSQVAKLLNAEPEEIFFTSSGTEADNTVLRGILPRDSRPCRIVSTQIEHPAVLRTLEAIQTDTVRVSLAAPDAFGVIHAETLEKELTPDTVLVSVMAANNEIGTVEPLRELSHAAHAHGAVFHTDAVQAAGHIPLDVKRMGIDFLSLSGHKLGAPQGIGALYIRKGLSLMPCMTGGGQERGIRSGTENVAGIVGLGAAAELAVKQMETETARLQAFQKRLTREILKIPGSYLTGHPTDRLAGITSFCFEGVQGEALVLTLDLLGAAVSSGSACSAGHGGISYVLRAIGMESELAEGSLRVSLGAQTSEDEVERLIALVREAVARLRAMSPTAYPRS